MQYYLYAVSLPDRCPHGERGGGDAADTVEQRQAGTGPHCSGHLTGEHWEAAQGKAACIQISEQLTVHKNMTLL